MYKEFLLIFRLMALIFTFVRDASSSLLLGNSNTNLASSCDKDDQRLNSLPHDIWSEILARLPAQTIVKCRIVCKTWNELTRTDHFIDLQYRKTNNDPPCLIVQSRINRNSLLLLDDNRFKKIDLQVDRRLRRSKCWSVCNGMICMEVIGTGSCLLFIINPLTSEYVQLPSVLCRPSPCSETYGFGFDESSGKYKVVRLYAGPHIEYGRCNRFEILTVGESSWRHLSSPEDIFWPTSASAVGWNGFLFWLGMPGLLHYPLLAFDLCNEEFCSISQLSALRLGGYCRLVVLGESLAVVKVKPFDRKIKVWKINGNKVEGFHLLNEIVYDMRIWYTCPKLRVDLYHILVKVCIFCDGEDILIDFFEDEKENECDERWLEPFPFRPTLITPVVCNSS